MVSSRSRSGARVVGSGGVVSRRGSAGAGAGAGGLARTGAGAGRTDNLAGSNIQTSTLIGAQPVSLAAENNVIL